MEPLFSSLLLSCPYAKQAVVHTRKGNARKQGEEEEEEEVERASWHLAHKHETKHSSYFNGRDSFQLFVGVKNTCLLLPSDDQVAQSKLS